MKMKMKMENCCWRIEELEEKKSRANCVIKE